MVEEAIDRGDATLVVEDDHIRADDHWLRAGRAEAPLEASLAVVPLDLARETAADVTLDELHLETFLPADAATQAWLEAPQRAD